MIVRSPFPDVTIPDVPFTPYVLQHSERLAEKLVLIDGATAGVLATSDIRSK